MAEYRFKCPMCGGTLAADTEAELVSQVQKHSQEKHGKEMTEQQAKDMIKSQAGG